MRQTKENVLAAIYNNAFSSSYTGADGQSLCSLSHPTLNGNQSNLLTTAADLSELALEDLVIQIMQTTNNRGLRISLLPESLHVPPALWFEANRILASVLQSNSSTNNINVLKASGTFPKGIKINHYFISSTAFFVRTNVEYGLQMFQRDPISFDQDNDFDTKNAKAACYERYSASWSDWRGLFATPGV